VNKDTQYQIIQRIITQCL